MVKWKQSKKNVDVPLDLLKPNFKNPRKGEYDKGKLEELKTSLDSMGQFNAVKIDENGVLLAGHRRYQAAKELGWDKNHLKKLANEIHENAKHSKPRLLLPVKNGPTFRRKSDPPKRKGQLVTHNTMNRRLPMSGKDLT